MSSAPNAILLPPFASVPTQSFPPPNLGTSALEREMNSSDLTLWVLDLPSPVETKWEFVGNCPA